MGVRIDKRLVLLRITDEHPEQRLKNAASRRLIPLHSVVVPSFRRYLKGVEGAGQEWV